MVLDKIFNTKNPIIGMVHFPPLPGHRGFPGIEKCLEKSLDDAKTLEDGGVDAIMVENNYDIPHKEFVDSTVAETMAFLTKKISEMVHIPLGINVLWNDYKTALLIANTCGARFVRIPVFTDSVETQYGKIFAKPLKILSFRKEIGADDIAIFTDIHVKHAKMIEEKSITESVKEAIKEGSDGLIITGKWTGDAPNLSDLKEAREAAIDGFPILVGSGSTKNNVKSLLRYANGTIVGTALKTGGIHSKEKEINLKPWEEAISLKKTTEFVRSFRDCLHQIHIKKKR